MKKRWLTEAARDLIAFGGLPFLFLTIVRVAMLGEPYYPAQFIAGSVLLLVLRFLHPGSLRAGVGSIVLIFTSLYYDHIVFTLFAALTYGGFVLALIYLGESRKSVGSGLLLGWISAGLAHVVVDMLIRR